MSLRNGGNVRGIGDLYNSICGGVCLNINIMTWNTRLFEYGNNNCYVSFKIKDTDILALAVHAHNAFECRE